MCLQMKVQIHERMPGFLQVKSHEIEYYIPRAVVMELELLGRDMQPAIDLAKSFRIIEPHEYKSVDGTSVDVTSVIESIIGERNERKFLVATQEVELRKALRMIPGVPLMYLNRSVLVFEDISRATLAIVRQEEKSKMMQLDVTEKRKLATLEEKDEELTADRLRKKPRAKAPNPLSCKKPTKKKIRSKKRKGVE